MRDDEKRINDFIHEHGTITRQESFKSEGVHVEQFTVEYGGETYSLTKWDGEWVYFYHWNK